MKKTRLHKRIFLSILFMIFFIFTSSPAQELAYQQFTTTDGLPSDQVYGIHQCQDGFLWFATENGLSRYDGKNFVNYTVFDGLPGTEILGFFEDSKKRLWFHTLNGRIGFYFKGVFYNQQNTDFLKGAFLEDFIIDSEEDLEGNIYFLTRYSIIKVNESGNVSTTKLSFEAAKIIKNINGQLFLIEEKSFATKKIYSIPNINKIDFDIEQFDRQAKRKMVFLNGPKVSEIFDLNNKDEQIIESKESRFLEYKDRLLVYGINTPLQIFDLKTKKRIRKNKQSLITEAFVDSEENIWIGSLGDGAFLFNNSVSYLYTAGKHFKGKKLTSFLLDEGSGKIYCGSNEGILNVISEEGLTSRQITSPNKNSFSRIKAIEKLDNEKIWLICDSHLEVIDSKTLKEKPESKACTLFKKMSPKSLYKNDSSKHAYIARARSVSKINYGEDWCKEESIFNQRSTTVHLDSQGKLWIGTGNGLYISENIIAPYKFERQLVTDPISCINHLDSILIVGTKGAGVLFIDGKSMKRITTGNGIPSNLIRSINVTKDKTIWVATDRGLSKITMDDKKELCFFNITKDNGLISNDVVSSGIMDNSLYVLCTQGINKIDLDKINMEVSSPSINFEQIWVNTRAVEKDTSYQFSNKQNNLHFQYVSIYFGNRSQLFYHYKLHGYHRKWKETSRNELYFEQLPPGDYQLEIYAEANGKRSTRPLSIQFQIEPAFYQRKSIQLLGLLLLGLFIFYLSRNYMLKEQKKIKIEKRLIELEQLALQSQMNPHFIKNSLGAIQHLMLKKDVLAANKYLTVFGDLITKLLKQSDQSLIKLTDEVKLLELYLSIEKLRFENNFEYKIDWDYEDFIEEKIPSMMIQPLVENSIIHGFRDSSRKKKNELNISFSVSQNYLVCIVKDNGIGIKENRVKNQANKKKTGIAINNIQERISLLSIKKPKTSFNIVESEKEGTIIKLCLPIYN